MYQFPIMDLCAELFDRLLPRGLTEPVKHRVVVPQQPDLLRQLVAVPGLEEQPRDALVDHLR